MKPSPDFFFSLFMLYCFECNTCQVLQTEDSGRLFFTQRTLNNGWLDSLKTGVPLRARSVFLKSQNELWWWQMFILQHRSTCDEGSMQRKYRHDWFARSARLRDRRNCVLSQAHTWNVIAWLILRITGVNLGGLWRAWGLREPFELHHFLQLR